MSKNILKEISEKLTEKPVIIRFSKKPQSWFERILSKSPFLTRIFLFFGVSPLEKKIEVSALTLGTLYRVSGLINEISITKPGLNAGLDWIFLLIESNAPKVAEIIAAAIHNKKTEPPASLVSQILEGFTPAEIARIMQALKDSIDIESFINTIVSVRSLNILSPEETSQQITGEKIALGQELGQQ